MKSSKANFLEFICSSFRLKVHSELLCDAKTGMAANRHGHCSGRVCHVPVHAEPKVHSRANSNIRGCSGQQRVRPAPGLSDSSNALIRGIKPDQIGTNKPFPG